MFWTRGMPQSMTTPINSSEISAGRKKEEELPHNGKDVITDDKLTGNISGIDGSSHGGISGTSNVNNSQTEHGIGPSPSQVGTASALPLSMMLLKPFWMVSCCEDCDVATSNRRQEDLDPFVVSNPTDSAGSKPFSNSTLEKNLTAESNEKNLQVKNNVEEKDSTLISSISPSPEQRAVEIILHEYTSASKFYGCPSLNAGILTTLRFSLPTLRVSGNFHDSDMLALAEILLRHCNGALKHIRRLDFSVASLEGKLNGKRGFRSHGAFTLAKVLQISKHIEEVFLQRNIVGPYGASAIFMAASQNPVLRTLVMRRCRVGERGALAFAEHIGKSKTCGLKEVDLSVNKIGFKGCIAIERALLDLEMKGRKIELDLEGNLVLQEVMNGITHGLGIILSTLGAFMLSNRVKYSSANHTISCGVYSTSLFVLYLSSTLYHSFFALKTTRYVFEVLDHCAIYILIAGSYTPFLRISLEDKVLGSVYLLSFLWTCCVAGIYVEAFHPNWIYKSKFSLAMYLGMGWSCLVCIPDLKEKLSYEAVQLIILGGIAYTSGVPFFVRNNNLDHSIWHLFVLAGSILHWLCVYVHVAPMASQMK